MCPDKTGEREEGISNQAKKRVAIDAWKGRLKGVLERVKGGGRRF